GKRIDEEEGTTGRVSSDIEEIRMDEREVAVKRTSEDTKEMATVLTFMDAATVLASETAKKIPTGSGSIPTAGAEVPTGSDVVPTASLVFATATVVTPYSRRKGKEVMREDKRMSEQIARDAEVARIHAEEELQSMIDGLDRNNETIVKYLQEYQQFAAELPLERRIELIIFRNNLRWKVKDFKGMIFEEVKAKFNSVYKQMEDFIPMGSKEEAKRYKRKAIRFDQESSKKLKSSEEVIEEAKEDLNQLWILVKEYLSIKPASSDKEMELWVELKRLDYQRQRDIHASREGLSFEEGSSPCNDLLKASSGEFFTDGK
nr:hypothetical protein [Tanacetum cinerariifolium]